MRLLRIKFTKSSYVILALNKSPSLSQKYTLMSSKQHDEWDRQLSGDDMPELTLETVMATFQQLNASKLDTFEQGIIDVFRALSWDYKTNNPCKIGKKIIVSRLLDVYRSG